MRRRRKHFTHGIIYKWTSPIGKSYIGQTVNPKARKHDFLGSSYYYAGEKINRARKKYGPENFTYEILIEIKCANEKELFKSLDYWEIFYIKKYNSVKNGYNISEGGQKHIPDFKITKKQRKLASERVKEYYKTHKSVTAKPVAQYSKNGQLIYSWESARKAGLALNIAPCSITDCCKGKVKSSGGYLWRYVINNMIPNKIEPFHNTRAIVQCDINGNVIKIWKTCTEAAKSMNYCVSYFNKLCNGLNDHIARGYKFYKLDNYGIL